MTRYRIQAADPVRDREEILAVLARNLPDITAARLRWNTEACPHGSARWWLAREASTRKAVGVCGLFPRRFRLNGRSCLAGVLGDFAVDLDHRAFGPAWDLQKHLLSELPGLGFSFVYTTPNSLSTALILRLGFRPVGTPHKFHKVLRTEYRQGISPRLRTLTRAAVVLDPVLAFLSRERFWRRPPGLLIETPERFDGRFDRLWTRVAEGRPIIAERTSEHLNWRYGKCPDRAYHCFALLDAEQEVLGYVVYHVQDNVCRVADQITRSPSELGRALLSEFLLHLRRLRVGSVVLHGLAGRELIREFSSGGFLRLSGDPIPLMAYPLDPGPLSALVMDPEAWTYFEGDNDL